MSTDFLQGNRVRTIDLGSLATFGYSITGRSGAEVLEGAPVGDVNGDGLDDFILGDLAARHWTLAMKQPVAELVDERLYGLHQ